MGFMSAVDEDEDNEVCKENNAQVEITKAAVPAIEAIIFLYKLVEGAAKKSYGLNVARLAGMPETILTKASYKSSQMENEVQQKMWV